MQLDLFGKEAIRQKRYNFNPYHKKEILLRHSLDSQFRLVWDILKKHKSARNCDNRLVWLAWTNNEDIEAILLDFYKFKELQKNYNWKSMVRCRRLIQNTHGYFPPTDEKVREQRYYSEQCYKQWVIEAKDNEYIKDMNCDP
jgi:hypothetical protein|tara:strand:- start:553 stop:978 length:426 start_codon:yes stop_codon:yes gene_type:complete